MDIMKGRTDGEVLTPTVPENLRPANTNAISEAASMISSAKQPVLLLGLLALPARSMPRMLYVN